MAERLYILDAHSLIYQVFHAIPEMTSPSGTPTNAIFGFVRDLQFVRRQKKPSHLICAFDASGVTFRHEISSDYKATRPPMPDDLGCQISMIHQILEAYRIPVLSEVGLEADDFLATVARRATEKKLPTYLCTADKDVRQCITDYATILDLRRNRIIDREFLQKDWGISPEQVVDYQAMVGDSTDNIPGIAGVGPKTAQSLLEKYPTLEAIYEHIDEIPKKGVRDKLYKGRKAAETSRELVRLKDDVPLPEDWDGYRLQTPDYDRLIELFEECGFHRFIDEIKEEAPDTVEPWVAEYVAVTTTDALDELVAQLSEQERLSVDLETTNIRPTEADIVGYALSWEQGKAYYVAVAAPKGETELDPAETLAKFKPILENPNVEKTGQNLKYDMVVLRQAGVKLQGLAFDSMVASYLLEPGERNHNLDSLALRLLHHQTTKIGDLVESTGRKKVDIHMEEIPVSKVADYAGEDADVALRLTNILEPRLQQAKLDRLFHDLEKPLIEVLATMEYHGVRVDPQRLKAQSQEYAGRLEEIRELAHEAGGREFNLDSPADLRVLLFDELNLPVVKRTKSGPSTDQEVLEQLEDKHPVCALVLEHRKLSKLKSTYLDALTGLINPRTGRIHASFNQTVAATGRLSSSDPNLQNIPIRTEEGKQIRQAFVSEDDNVLLSADYSQIELRFLASFSGDETLIGAFADDLDIHSAVAAEISGVDPADVDKDLRRKAKAVNFGIMYGLSPFGLARQLKISKQEASEFIDAYFARYPRIEDFFTRVLESAKSQRYVETILGRRRPISGVRNTTGRNRNLPERTAINTVIQGSAADLIKRAMCTLHRRFEKENLPARMLLQIHDELVFEVPKDAVEETASIVVEEMTGAMALEDVPLKVDVGAGVNWLDLNPVSVYAAAR